MIILIRKPGKDETKPVDDRPIALTSNKCKIMERMINDRLMSHIESKGSISQYQSGFTRGSDGSDFMFRKLN